MVRWLCASTLPSRASARNRPAALPGPSASGATVGSLRLEAGLDSRERSLIDSPYPVMGGPTADVCRDASRTSTAPTVQGPLTGAMLRRCVNANLNDPGSASVRPGFFTAERSFGTVSGVPAPAGAAAGGRSRRVVRGGGRVVVGGAVHRERERPVEPSPCGLRHHDEAPAAPAAGGDERDRAMDGAAALADAPARRHDLRAPAPLDDAAGLAGHRHGDAPRLGLAEEHCAVRRSGRRDGERRGRGHGAAQPEHGMGCIAGERLLDASHRHPPAGDFQPYDPASTGWGGDKHRLACRRSFARARVRDTRDGGVSRSDGAGTRRGARRPAADVGGRGDAKRGATLSLKVRLTLRGRPRGRRTRGYRAGVAAGMRSGETRVFDWPATEHMTCMYRRQPGVRGADEQEAGSAPAEHRPESAPGDGQAEALAFACPRAMRISEPPLVALVAASPHEGTRRWSRSPKSVV